MPLNALEALGGAVTFGIFLAVALFSIAFIAFIAFIAMLAPEIKGRPLENIRQFWENRGRWPERSAP